MAHFAKIDESGIVTQIVVTSNDLPGEGLDWLQSVIPGTWIKTSYNTVGGAHILGGDPLRKNYAVVGGRYDSDLDAFIPPKPTGQEFAKYVLDPESFLWVDPNPPSESVNTEIQYPDMPAPRPGDATYVIGYEAEPENINDIQNKKIYVWLDKYSDWGLLSAEDSPPPSDGQYYSWNPLTKSWEQPDSDSPGENFYWDALEKSWLELPVDDSGYEVV